MNDRSSKRSHSMAIQPHNDRATFLSTRPDPAVKLNLLNPRSLLTNCSFEFENDTLETIVRKAVRDDGMTFHLVKVLVLETSQVRPVEPLDPQRNYIDEIQGIVSESNLLTYDVQTSLGLAER